MTDLTRRHFLTGGASLATATILATPALANNFHTWDVTRIQVRKSARKLDLVGAGRILKSYDIRLGSAPVGHKHRQSDGRTPEGAYSINRRNPASRYFRSLGISYPNAHDMAQAQRRGVSPGGDIFIHGQPNGYTGTIRQDWTRGCVAVSNRDMQELWSVINIGCRVQLYT